jgi:hypothetical protein
MQVPTAGEFLGRSLLSASQLPKVIQGVKFTDGIEAVIKPTTPRGKAAA